MNYFATWIITDRALAAAIIQSIWIKLHQMHKYMFFNVKNMQIISQTSQNKSQNRFVCSKALHSLTLALPS